jgi:RNA polymerase sigma-70 factor (ECF subfamily)
MNDETLANRANLLVQGKARFLRFLEARTGSRADAEDVLQAAFLKLVAQPDALRDDEKLIPWFYQLLRNLVVDHYRHRDALARLEASVAADPNATTAGADETLFEAVCACVNALIPELKTEQAELVRRVELGGEPIHRVAGDLRITPNNASVRLHRARRALREALLQMCGVCADHGCLDCTCAAKEPPRRER